MLSTAGTLDGNIGGNGAEEVYTLLTGHQASSYDEGWIMPNDAFRWIEENIKENAAILEFGSGDGSQRLSKRYNLWSVEHDREWIGKTQSNYVHAEIVSNPWSEKLGEAGWYDPVFLDAIPESVELIIIDGPVGTIGRGGILHVLERLPKFQYLLVDDTDRKEERALSEKICEMLQLKITRIETNQRKSNGDKRSFDILQN